MISSKYKKAWQSAIDLLSRRNHSMAEMRTKLKQRGFSLSEIEAVLEACQKDNYINDDATAEMWIRNFIRKGLGPYRIRLGLKQKGLDPEAFDRYLDNNPDTPDPLETARQALLRKKSAFLRETDSRRRQQKMYRFLYNKGFSGETISQAIKSADLASDR